MRVKRVCMVCQFLIVLVSLVSSIASDFKPLALPPSNLKPKSMTPEMKSKMKTKTKTTVGREIISLRPPNRMFANESSAAAGDNLANRLRLRIAQRALDENLALHKKLLAELMVKSNFVNSNNHRRPSDPLTPAGSMAPGKMISIPYSIVSAAPLEFAGESQASINQQQQQQHKQHATSGNRHLGDLYQQQQHQHRHQHQQHQQLDYQQLEPLESVPINQPQQPLESVLINQPYFEDHDSDEKDNPDDNHRHNLMPSASYQVVHIHHKGHHEREASKKGKYLWPLVGGGLTILISFLMISNLLLSIPLLAISASSLSNLGGFQQQQQLVPVYNLSQLVTTRAPSGRRRRDAEWVWRDYNSLVTAHKRAQQSGLRLALADNHVMQHQQQPQLQLPGGLCRRMGI